MKKIYYQIIFFAWRLSKKNSLFEFFFTKANYLVSLFTQIKILRKIRELKKKNIIDRYLKDDNDVQFLLLTDENSSKIEIKSLKILFNHFRTPYQIKNINDLSSKSVINKTKHKILFYSCNNRKNINLLKKKISNINCLVIFFKQSFEKKEKNKYFYLRDNPEILIDSIEGYRSNLVRKVVNIFFKSNFMILTGILPPVVAMRIDDVTGSSYSYLKHIQKNRWFVNLGIFLNKFGKNPVYNKLMYKLNRSNKIEISPHSLDEFNFLYFDYLNGREFNSKFIKKNITTINNFFKKYKVFKSDVVNAHFHTFSEKMLKQKFNYVYSEFKPNTNIIVPSSKYLPSGNPFATTGQINNKNFIQIYSGDSCALSNLNNSNYDFLRKINKRKKLNEAYQKIVKKIDLSLSTGFPCFITTHEDLIYKFFLNDFNILLNKVNNFLNHHPMKPIKSSMTDIGINCYNHTNLILDKVQVKNKKIMFSLKGHLRKSHLLIGFKNSKLYNFRISNKDINKSKHVQI